MHPQVLRELKRCLEQKWGQTFMRVCSDRVLNYKLVHLDWTLGRYFLH